MKFDDMIGRIADFILIDGEQGPAPNMPTIRDLVQFGTKYYPFRATGRGRATGFILRDVETGQAWAKPFQNGIAPEYFENYIINLTFVVENVVGFAGEGQGFQLVEPPKYQG